MITSMKPKFHKSDEKYYKSNIQDYYNIQHLKVLNRRMKFSYKVKIDSTILTCLNQRKELSVTDVRTDPNYKKASLLKGSGKNYIVKKYKIYNIKI